MAAGKNCARCGRDIGVWPIFTAARPDRIRCPHCKVRLRFRNTQGLRTAMVVIAGLAGVTALIAAGELAPSIRLSIVGLVVLSTWFVLELLVVWYLQNRHALEVAEPGAK